MSYSFVNLSLYASLDNSLHRLLSSSHSATMFLVSADDIDSAMLFFHRRLIDELSGHVLSRNY